MAAPDLDPESCTSFDPDAAVPTVPGTGDTLLAVEQIKRPPLLIKSLALRCACGARLCGCEYWFFADSLHARGVCMQCGEQAVIFAPPRVHTEQGARENAAIVTQDMLSAVEDLIAMARDEADTAETGTVIATTEVASQLR